MPKIKVASFSGHGVYVNLSLQRTLFSFHTMSLRSTVVAANSIKDDSGTMETKKS